MSLTNTVTAEDLESYYQENYVCVKYIKLYTDRHMAKQDDGSFLYSRDLTEAEQATKRALLTEIFERATNGESFAYLQEKYTEENMDPFPNGLLFDVTRPQSSSGVFGDLFLEQVYALADGDRNVLLFEDGALGYVLYRCSALPDRDLLTSEEKVLLDGLSDGVADHLFNTHIKQFADEVEETELLSSINFAEIPVNRGFNL